MSLYAPTTEDTKPKTTAILTAIPSNFDVILSQDFVTPDGNGFLFCMMYQHMYQSY